MIALTNFSFALVCKRNFVVIIIIADPLIAVRIIHADLIAFLFLTAQTKTVTFL